MRLYMTIPGYEKNIKIRSIEFDNQYVDSRLPIIYIRCHRKYEEYFSYGTQIVHFHNKYGKVLFTSLDTRLNFRCYESDMHEDVKFRGIILISKQLEVIGLGKISKNYLQNILKDTCNSQLSKKLYSKRELKKQQKIVEEACEENREELKDTTRQIRITYFWRKRMRCFSVYYLLYIKHTRRHMRYKNKRYKTIFFNIEIISRAPT